MHFYFHELDHSMDSKSTYHSFKSYCKQWSLLDSFVNNTTLLLDVFLGNHVKTVMSKNATAYLMAFYEICYRLFNRMFFDIDIIA